jgi:hypothetical protein
MIIQQPKQLKDTKRWRMVETSDEDSAIFNELCDCTLGHSTECEAKICADKTQLYKNPVKRAKAAESIKCYGCKFHSFAQIPTKLTMATEEVRGVFHGTMLHRWCERTELQTEESEYNQEYIEVQEAEANCDVENDGNYIYFEPTPVLESEFIRPEKPIETRQTY